MIKRIIFKTLFSGRIGVVTVIAIASFIFGSFCFLLPYIFSLNTNSLAAASTTVVASILLGVGTSTLAASLVSTLENIRTNQITKLIKLFSIDNGKKIAIVIPHFGSEYFNEKKENAESVRNLSGITGISYADFVASKYLVGLFQKFNIVIPDVITDHEAIEIVSNSERVKKYCTFISIGLYSNHFSQRLNSEDNSTRLFEFTDRDYDKPGNRTIRYKDEIVIPHVWHHYSPNNLSCSDIAVFSKVVSKSSTNEKYTAILCGGLNATGTSVICNTIYDKWESEICSLSVRDNMDKNKNILDCEYFTILYKVNGESNVRYDPKASISLEPILKLGK